MHSMRSAKSLFGIIVVASILASFCALPSRVSGQESRKALVKPTPKYPEVAKRMSLTGTVKIEITVAPNGEVKNTNVIGGHPILVDAALEAVKRWKYEPAKTETTVVVQFDFHP